MSVHDAACYTGLFLIRPALFENGTDGQSEWTKDDRRGQAVVLKDFGLNFFYFILLFFFPLIWMFIGNIYCMLSTGPRTHTWTIGTTLRACVCARHSMLTDQRVVRGLEGGRDVLRSLFGLPAHNEFVYM